MTAKTTRAPAIIAKKTMTLGSLRTAAIATRPDALVSLTLDMVMRSFLDHLLVWGLSPLKSWPAD